MFTTKEFTKVKEANEYIKKLLAELETPKSLEFQVIHSISETECEESGSEWDGIGKILLNYLRDLDAQQGFMYFLEDPGCWDYVEAEEPQKDEIHKPINPHELYVYAGEGLVVLYNQYAVCEDQYPVIVVKKSFFDSQKKNALEMLRYCNPGDDYTASISPAVYVELFYSEPNA